MALNSGIEQESGNYLTMNDMMLLSGSARNAKLVSVMQQWGKRR
jgi:hypothetical protein